MRPLHVHVPSVAIGVTGLALVLLSMGQTVPLLGPPRIEYGPNPHDYIQIKEGTSYTVPPGRLFVLTGLGLTRPEPAFPCQLKVNGQVEVTGGIIAGGGSGYALAASASVAGVAPGFTVPAGAVIDVDDQVIGMIGRAWGYLAPQ